MAKHVTFDEWFASGGQDGPLAEKCVMLVEKIGDEPPVAPVEDFWAFMDDPMTDEELLRWEKENKR